MSRQAIELFRQYTERLKQEPQGPEHTAQKAQAPSEDPKKPILVAEMSRIEHEVRQIFDDASSAERDNIIRFLEILIRNLKRVRQAENE
jgi:hypothetical protein